MGVEEIEERRVKWVSFNKEYRIPRFRQVCVQIPLCIFCVAMSTLLNFLSRGFFKCRWINDVYRAVRVS